MNVIIEQRPELRVFCVRHIGPYSRIAKAVHVGPYEELGDAWARFMGQWLPQSDERLGEGVPYEVYVNDPMEVPKEQLVTALYLPLVLA